MVGVVNTETWFRACDRWIWLKFNFNFLRGTGITGFRSYRSGMTNYRRNGFWCKVKLLSHLWSYRRKKPHFKQNLKNNTNWFRILWTLKKEFAEQNSYFFERKGSLLFVSITRFLLCPVDCSLWVNEKWLFLSMTDKVSALSRTKSDYCLS